jgi:hypothetical protein
MEMVKGPQVPKKSKPTKPPTFNPNGRTQKDSVRNHLTKMRGDFANDGKPWIQQDYDLLMECFLVRELGKYRPDGKSSIMSILQRSLDSIETRLRKIGIRYKEVKNWVSNPANRTDNSRLAFSDRDLFLLSHMLGERGRKEGACDPPYIAMVLGRSVENVKKWLDGRYEMVVENSFLKPVSKIDESSDQFIARIVSATMTFVSELKELLGEK